MSRWPRKNLGEIVDFLSGFAWKAANFSDDRSGVPIIRIQNVDAVRVSDFVYWVDEYDSRFIVKEGDLLLTLSGSFRVEFWAGPNALLNQRIVKITPKSGIDSNWLMHSLRGALAKIEAMGRHALVNNVALSDLRQMELSLPPLEEQKRIAAILDQAEDIRRKRQHAIDRLNQLGQAIFHEMFGDPVTNPRGFPKIALGDLIKVSSGSGLIASEQNGGDYPVYGGNGINGWHDDFTVPSGTIVIGRVGVYCGAVHITNQPAWVTDNALIVSLKQPINRTYLVAALKIANLNQYAGRSAQPLVSGSRIYPIEIVQPSIVEQAAYETKIHNLAKILSSNGQSKIGLDGLFASLQHRAFKGQL